MSSSYDLTFNISTKGASEAAAQIKNIGTAASQAGSQVSSSGAGFSQFARDADKAGSAAATNASKMQSFGKSLSLLSGGFAISGIIGIVKAIDNVGDAQDRARAAGTRLEQANFRIEKAQLALNEAIAKYGPNSQQAQIAAQALAIAQDRGIDAANRLKNAQEDVGFAMADVAAQMASTGGSIGAMIAGFGSLGGALTNLKNVAGGIKSAFTGLGIAGMAGDIGKLGGALSNFGGAANTATSGLSKLATILGPLGLVIGGVVGALVGADAAVKAHGNNLQQLAQDYQKTGNVIKSTGTGFDVIGNALNGLNKFLIENFSQWKQLNDVAAGGGKALKDAGEDAQAAAADFAALQQAAEELSGSLSDAFKGGLEGARGFGDKFQDDINSIKEKMRDLQSGFVTEADRAGTVKIDWEKVFQFEALQNELKSKMTGMKSTFTRALNELGIEQVPPGLANFGQRMADALPSENEVSGMMQLLAAGIRKGGTGIAEAGGAISKELREGFAGMDKPAQDAVLRIETNFERLKHLKPGTEAFFQVVQQITQDLQGLSDVDATIDIKADTVNVIAGTQKATEAVQQLPTQKTTTLKADPIPATQGAQQAGTAITQQVPQEKSTMLSIEGLQKFMTDAGATAQAIGLVPGLKNTKLVAEGGSIVTATAGQVALSLSARGGYPDDKNTKLTTDGGPLAIAGITAVGQAIGLLPKEKSTELKTEGGPKAIADAQQTSNTIRSIPDERVSQLGTQGAAEAKAGASGVGTAVMSIPDNKNSKISESGGSVVSEIARGIGNLFKPQVYPDNKNTNITASDRASSTINGISNGLNSLRDRNVTISVTTISRTIKAAGGFSGVIGSPTRFLVGERGPEIVSRNRVHAAANGFDGIVKSPTHFLAGEAGPELVNVIPLKGGTSSGSDILRLTEAIDRLVIVQKGGGRGNNMNANLFLDGQRLASSVSKYTGTKSYGDR